MHVASSGYTSPWRWRLYLSSENQVNVYQIIRSENTFMFVVNAVSFLAVENCCPRICELCYPLWCTRTLTRLTTRCIHKIRHYKECICPSACSPRSQSDGLYRYRYIPRHSICHILAIRNLPETATRLYSLLHRRLRKPFTCSWVVPILRMSASNFSAVAVSWFSSYLPVGVGMVLNKVTTGPSVHCPFC
jgi:hypothetical protein